MMVPNRLAVLRSVAARIENKIAATVAVPNAAPTERENCTMAAPVPSMRGPATVCTVICTTPMTVPMNSAMKQNAHGIWPRLRCDIPKARNTNPTVAAINP